VSLKSFLFLAAVALTLPACANSPWAGTLERSFAPDPQLNPQLKNNPVAIGLPSPSPSVSPSPSPVAESPTAIATPNAKPGDPNFIGPIPPAQPNASSPSPAASPIDLSQVPSEVQTYITDLTNLGALQVTGSNGFEPGKTVTRREYARWLVAANNSIYSNVPARKIRPGTSSDQPAFKDVATSDPDFGEIQGLANAGVIPSGLSGDTGATNFRPNSPLTREDLIAWKVPVDMRRSLPNATIDAVLADYQNGDLSNIRRAFGYTTLFNPKKTVSRAEAAGALWFFGAQGDGLSAKDALQGVPPSPEASPQASPTAAP
jgi:S-layer homology domain